jgi:hypothetical protein
MGGSEFELNFKANRQFIKKPRRVICCYIVFYQNPKFIGLKMAKIQWSDGLMGKGKIDILNIDSILNNLGRVKCQSACYNKSKISLRYFYDIFFIERSILIQNFN